MSPFDREVAQPGYYVVTLVRHRWRVGSPIFGKRGSVPWSRR